ncbi:MAG TPA: lysophospholipid acyltransferase family protein [Candidatus Obscuribacterales bacterium]
MLDFRPPKDTPWLISLVKLLSPLYMKVSLHDTRLQIVDGALERFRKLHGQRALVCPNHSNRHDPQVMFCFSKYVGEEFNFVAAREVFDWDRGLNGWWLQHLGTYSVVRGAPDRESFKMTKKILVEGKKKLVLFPEGEISRQNDTLMPLETGAAQLSYWAFDELKKTQPEATIHIIPMALKYTYPTDIKPALDHTLSLIEEKLGLRSPGKGSLYERLLAASQALLLALEKEYNLKPKPEATLLERIRVLRSAVLDKMAGYFKMDGAQGDKLLDSVRVLRNKIDDFIYEDDETLSEYQRQVHEEKAATMKGFYKDLDRVVNFVAIYDTYVKEHMTQERFTDVLERLEHEVLGGEPTIKGPRTVLVDVGNAIDLQSYGGAYKSNKRDCLAKITDELFSQISTMLAKLDKLRNPIYVD